MLKRFFLLCFFFLLSTHSFSQDNVQKVITNLNEIIKPLKTLNADSNFNDIDFLKDILDGKEVIALGEVTHGSREIFDYKDRLVRFLVVNLGFKAIAFESDYISLEIIDDYINGKLGQVKSLSGTPLHINNLRMIEWLKKYNSSQSEENKVHVYGLEARGFNNISARILQVFIDLNTSDRQILEKLKQTYYVDLKKDDINAIATVVENLNKLVKTQVQQHYINLLAQNAEIYYEQKIGVRDKYMSENASWLRERAKNKKLIVWAHNGHVAKTALYSKPSMGNFLFNKYDKKYFVIATDFNHGEVLVRQNGSKSKTLGQFSPYYYPEVTSNKSYEYYFKQCRFKNFIVDVNASIKNPVLNTLLSRPMDMRMIGATSNPFNKRLSITDNFDLIVYFDSTTSAK